ncbi:MAG TPA: hemolysin family protein [Pyrinomonadaceae bacterium]|nr:hemolysin family protein [Pyrinomonadaceae bacterium]
MLTLTYIVIVFFLVFANGFFVASEFALVGVRRSRIEMLAGSGSLRARRLLGLLDNLNAYISATQLGITMASLALGWIGEPVFAHLLEAPLKGRVSDVTLHTVSFATAFSIITFLHIVLGELAPKTLALERAEKVALAISWPMGAFYKVFQWPIRLLDWSGTRVVRLFGLHPTKDHSSVYTEAELRRLVDISRQSGELEPEAQQLIHRVFDFSDAQVREAMVPRTQVKALPVTATLEDIRAAFLLTGYSRLPVYGRRLDEIVGLLFRKDLDMGRIPHDGFDLKNLVRPPAFIPASTSLGEALSQMQASRVHFAFVVDEHGGMEGILTLEDLLEEIVGEINDEYDDEVREQIKKDGEIYLLDGMLAVRDANQYLELDLPESPGYTTIAGFLMERAGKVLKRGDKVEHEGDVFEIDRVEKHRISRIRLIPRPKREKEHSSNLPSLLGASVLAGQTASTLAVGVESLVPCI